jgi:hypothetical protein
MFFAPTQRFSAIAECLDFEFITFRTRDRDRFFALVRPDRHFKNYRSVDHSIRGRMSSNEVPTKASGRGTVLYFKPRETS